MNEGLRAVGCGQRPANPANKSPARGARARMCIDAESIVQFVSYNARWINDKLCRMVRTDLDSLCIDLALWFLMAP